MNRKAFGLAFATVALVSSAAWATGWHHHRGGDHPSRAWDKNPVFKKIFGGGSGGSGGSDTGGSEPPSGGGTSTPTYDYRNYIEAGTISRKTFATVGTPAAAICGDTEVRTYSRQADAAGTRIVETRARSLGSMSCQFDELEFLANDSGYLFNRVSSYDATGVSLFAQRFAAEPVPVYTSAMAGSWGSGSAIKDESGYTQGYLLESGTLLGVETVTVPHGTFSGCLKIEHGRVSAEAYTGYFSAISWVCPGLGEVKRIEGAPKRSNPSVAQMAEWVLTHVESTP